MSVIQPTIINPGVNAKFRDWGVITWAGLTGSDTGNPIEFVPYADRSVQVFGVFGNSLTALEFQGSNDGVNWTALKNPFNVSLQISAPALHTVIDVCRFVRPALLNGAGSDITCVLLFKY